MTGKTAIRGAPKAQTGTQLQRRMLISMHFAPAANRE